MCDADYNIFFSQKKKKIEKNFLGFLAEAHRKKFTPIRILNFNGCITR